MLFDPDLHEPLPPIPWDEARVRAWVDEVVRDCVDAFRGGDVPYRVHPTEDTRPVPGSLYLGVPGVVIGLSLLAESGVAVDPGFVARLGAWCDGYATEYSPGLLMGDLGRVLAAWRCGHGEPDGIESALRAAIPHPAREVMWGAPGVCLVARWLWARDPHPRWRQVWHDAANVVWSSWTPDPELGCRLWTQHLFGRDVRYVGAAHGSVGALQALLVGAEWLGDRADEVYREAVSLVEKTAVREAGEANWPAAVGEPPRLLQWCHGAPGIVTALASTCPGIDELLIAGGALVWRAGPLAKGPGICHGTAGNGYPLLALHARTGEAVWLERARAFAMAAIDQAERQRVCFGRRRHGLFNGDLGAAVYAMDCVGGWSGIPGVDRF